MTWRRVRHSLIDMPQLHRSIQLALLVYIVLGTAPALAQSEPHAATGSVAADFHAPVDVQSFLVDDATPLEKSVPLASALSALLPGAGQVYAEAPLWRTLLYAGIEAAGWTAYVMTSSRGRERTSEFESYAQQHWSLVRYIDWLGANYSHWSDTAVNKEAASEALAAVYTSTDLSKPEWERIDFVQLNRLEKAVRVGFSHTLPRYGHQQYYEQIGKYVQYRAGWDDHAGAADTAIYDPRFVTDRNDAYMDIRAEANDYLGYATAAIGGIIVNHLASLLDAALTARSFNASVRATIKGSIVPGGDEPLYAGVALNVRF